MKKVTVTITGLDKKTARYIVEKIRPILGGLSMELSEEAPYISPARMPEMGRKELIILTPFHTDRTPVPALAPRWYKALVPSPFPGDLPHEYRFRSPFSLGQVIAEIERKFSLDHRLTDLPIIFCVKQKGTENSWRSNVERILRSWNDERSG